MIQQLWLDYGGPNDDMKNSLYCNDLNKAENTKLALEHYQNVMDGVAERIWTLREIIKGREDEVEIVSNQFVSIEGPEDLMDKIREAGLAMKMD